MRNILVLIWIVCVSGFVAVPSAVARKKGSDVKDKLPPCSYTVMNDHCVITIDRMNPVTPPTIYVTRGGSVTVRVGDTSPFEDLTLDWKSSTTVIPPDTFQNLLGQISGNAGKFTDIVRIQATGIRTEAVDIARCETNTLGCDNAADISAGQERLLSSLRAFDPLASASDALKSIKIALQPPPAGQAVSIQPWHDTQGWKTTVTAQLQAPIDLAEKYNASLDLLASEIATFKRTNTSAQAASDASMLDTNQKSLKDAYDSVTAIDAKLLALKMAVSAIPDQGADITFSVTISDPMPLEKNYQTQIWAVDYTNKLLPTAQRVAADTLKSENAALLSGLATPLAKQQLVTITVQFQSPSPIEVSTGLMVPLEPYHNYAKASVASHGVVSDNIVQESKTYAVVPMVFVNGLAREWIVKEQRSALFGTGGIGITTATGMVEFSAGLTYSYRSIAISGLVDIGRDTKLGGGFTVGESLGATSAAANPITSTYWTVKPGVGISIRIPIGGSGK